jgi:hypothetical protein
MRSVACSLRRIPENVAPSTAAAHVRYGKNHEAIGRIIEQIEQLPVPSAQ